MRLFLSYFDSPVVICGAVSKTHTARWLAPLSSQMTRARKAWESFEPGIT